ncbi:MAG: PLP-dependent aminotransferase family protein, partial [Oscillospiraceae bacterium]|nr:PLP-dependent aminotransferase family protein [Oscillospiraceae bacterium]
NEVKLIYTSPTFQNPSGATMSLEKRKRLLELAGKYDVIIIEDNPYGDLRFSGEDVPTIKSLDTEGRVIYVGTFSKILSPGMRLGFVVGDTGFIDRIEVVKQVNDVHTPVFTQMIAHEFMKKFDMPAHIEKSRKLYGKKAAFMCEMIDKYFPEEVTYIKPEGGIFIWCTAPEYVDTNMLHKKCIDHNVAIVPGSNFSIDIGKPTNSFRLNYSTMPDDKIEQGIAAVGTVLKEFISG